MGKQVILKTLVLQLESTLKDLIHTAQVARDAATNEESRPENKYDTRALEASYLAGAQAKRSEELKTAIQKLTLIKLREFHDEDDVTLTALVKVTVNKSTQKTFFILPSAGGTKVTVDGQEIHIITPDSAVGGALVGKSTGDDFELTVNGRAFEYEISGIS
jgi:transcription elongation GreA/GreB family factor